MKALCLFFLIIMPSLVSSKTSVFIHPDNLKPLQNKNIRTIIQDKDETMWFGTSKGLYNYNGYELNLISLPNNNSEGSVINKLYLDKKGNVWAGSKNQGLFKKTNGTFISIPIDTKKETSVFDIIEDNGSLWVATDRGLRVLSNNSLSLIKLVKFLEPFKNETITALEVFINNDKLVATPGAFHIIDSVNKEIYSEKLVNTEIVIHDFFKDSNNILWIATSTGVLLYDYRKHVFLDPPIENFVKRALSIIEYENNIYIGTIGDGIYKINLNDYSVRNFKHEKGSKNAMISDNVYSLFLSQDGILWIGYFFKGVDKLFLNDLKFEYESNTKNGLYCMQNNIIYSGIIDEDNIFWLGNKYGLIRYTENKCQQMKFELGSEEKLFSLQSIVEVDKNIWFLSNLFIGYFDRIKKSIIFTDISVPPSVTFMFYFKKIQGFYIGSINGLYFYSIRDNTINKVTAESLLETAKINDYYVDEKKNIYFASSQGLAQIDNSGKLIAIDAVNSLLKHKNITAILKAEDKLYFAVDDTGLYSYDGDSGLQHLLVDQISIFNITLVDDNLWMGSDKGIIRFTNKENFKVFSEYIGLYKKVYQQSKNVKNNYELAYVGSNGLVHFDPRKIKLKEFVANIKLSKLFLMNKKVETNQMTKTGFILDKAINNKDLLELGYKEYIVGFEFNALDYADPQRNHYAYRLKGFQQDWVYTDASNRQATYTNLKSGDYTFQVKASNKDGVWSKQPKELKIKVYPAPWFSPWAYTAYVFLLVLLIWSYIRYKTIASRKRAIQLEKTIEERTQEVNRQKKMVESLLEHKNEVFANVTHEFKTPLALILGPSEQLAGTPELTKYSQELNMILRNAKRLMLMVAQILKLSQAENDKEVLRESQSVRATLLMLYESFKPLAENKNIHLSIKNEHDVNVYATSECLEVVVGNLLSNAIKYCNAGGKVSIESRLLDKQIYILVKDTGSGIEKKDLSKIFKRFTRLDTHKNIAGTGIGLSVVKAVTEANDGEVTVSSILNKGSTFTVSFPVTDIVQEQEMSQIMVDQLVANTSNEIIFEKKTLTKNYLKNRTTVLIIEDNLDMQSHIGSVLNNRFNCLFAERGREGIACALNEVPDIIICDVMMPGMDGYQVTRILRHDGRTSHIPIVLLTALNTKESRIKGWRENIDIYIAKPFDAKELNIQLDNILTIRKLLQQKTNKAIKKNESLKTLDLPKQDLKFIEKLRNVIGSLYANEYIQKVDIADKMAVSERQLHRKVKALIDENPMDMLRDYRLEKAAMKLKDGYQVAIVSDACGFSSVSYFGSCFKKKHGVTPKKYQGLDKKS